MYSDSHLHYPIGNKRWDNTRENGEVLILQKIPTDRVIGVYKYDDLRARCSLNWLIDQFETGAKYRNAISEIKHRAHLDKLMGEIATSAAKIESICINRKPELRVPGGKVVFDAFLYGLGKAMRSDFIASANILWANATMDKFSHGAKQNVVEAADEVDADMYGVTKRLAGLSIKSECSFSI